MELPIFLSLVSQTKQVMDGHILSAGVLRLCLCEPPVPARWSLTGGKGYRSGLQAASACWHWFVLRTRLLHYKMESCGLVSSYCSTYKIKLSQGMPGPVLQAVSHLGCDLIT